MSLPPCIVPLAEVALIDEAAEAAGIDIATLMERAGAALAKEAKRLAGNGLVLVACGPGNNGGDGWACARHLHAIGHPVAIWATSEPRSPLCIDQAHQCPAAIPRVHAIPPDTGLLVDAMLGAGASGRPRAPLDAIITTLRASGLPVLAADAPSGLGSDCVLPATFTVCFQVAKSELLGSPHVGEFTTIDIGIPDAIIHTVQPNCFRRFPRHRLDGHKGLHGELLVVGGGVFPGALEFACRAGVVTGCDLIQAWTTVGPSMPPTIIAHRQDYSHLHPAIPGELTPLIVRAGCVLIGNGLGRSKDAAEAAEQAFTMAQDMGVPTVIDADGLALLGPMLRALPDDAPPVLLTPHRGEARNLIGSKDDAALHAFARPNRIILAKGPVDFISDGRHWQHNPRGNPRMAVGGTGDILAGLAAGLIARGVAPFDAARIAVLWITEAADSVWTEQGPCYDALHVIGALPATLKRLLTPLAMWPPVTSAVTGR